MAPDANLRPITSARIAVIPPSEREEALAAIARAAGQPTLKRVEARSRVLTGDPRGKHDLVIGMYARVGCAGDENLTGVVRLCERFGRRLTSVETVASRDRAFLIDAIEIAEEMKGWHPPLRTLLVATAITIVATGLHDSSYRTYVACHVNADNSEEWPRDFDGHMIPFPDDSPARWSFGSVPATELRFLDTAAASAGAAILLDHLTRGTVPSHRYDLPGRNEACQAMLSIDFPRNIRFLTEEIAQLARAEIDVGWHTPEVAGNDVGFPLRAMSGG